MCTDLMVFVNIFIRISEFVCLHLYILLIMNKCSSKIKQKCACTVNCSFEHKYISVFVDCV